MCMQTAMRNMHKRVRHAQWCSTVHELAWSKSIVATSAYSEWAVVSTLLSSKLAHVPALDALVKDKIRLSSCQTQLVKTQVPT